MSKTANCKHERGEKNSIIIFVSWEVSVGKNLQWMKDVEEWLTSFNRSREINNILLKITQRSEGLSEGLSESLSEQWVYSSPRPWISFFPFKRIRVVVALEESYVRVLSFSQLKNWRLCLSSQENGLLCKEKPLSPLHLILFCRKRKTSRLRGKEKCELLSSSCRRRRLRSQIFATNSSSSQTAKSLLQTFANTWVSPAFIIYFYCRFVFHRTLFFLFVDSCSCRRERKSKKERLHENSKEQERISSQEREKIWRLEYKNRFRRRRLWYWILSVVFVHGCSRTPLRIVMQSCQDARLEEMLWRVNHPHETSFLMYTLM